MKKGNLRIFGVCIFLVFVIATYFFATGYYNQKIRAAQISDQNDILQSEIARINREYESLTTGQEQRLVKAESDLKMAQASYSMNEMRTNQVVEDVLNLGQNAGVEVIPLGTADWVDVKVGSNVYQQAQISVVITGEWDGLINFLNGLRSPSRDILVYEDLNVVIKSEPEKPDEYEATLTFIVYAKNS